MSAWFLDSELSTCFEKENDDKCQSWTDNVKICSFSVWPFNQHNTMKLVECCYNCFESIAFAASYVHSRKTIFLNKNLLHQCILLRILILQNVFNISLSHLGSLLTCM